MNVNPFSYLIEKLKGKVDKSGDTMSGNLTIQENGERYVKCANTGKSTAVFVQSASDGSHGVFSNGYYDGSFHSEDKWLLVRAGNNKVYVNGSVVPYGGELALKSDINVLEDITSQCTVNSALVTSYGSFKVSKQGHLIQVFLGNAKFDHNGDLQGGVVTGLPQAVEQGNATPTGDGSSKTAAILASGTAFWISKNATAIDGNIGSNTNNLWISLWYYCV